MITTEAIRLMNENRNRPFFLGVGFSITHALRRPKKYWNLYPIDKIRMPYAPEDDRADVPKSAFAHNCPIPNYGLAESDVLKAKQAYYANVSFVDAQVGRLLDALESMNLMENTMIVFWSDHGYHLGEHQGIWQKRCLFRGIRFGSFDLLCSGSSWKWDSQEIVEFVDLYPTMASSAV